METQLYVKKRLDDKGNEVIEGYAYGPEWVAMALYMDDMWYGTPEEAIDAWKKMEGKNEL